MKKGIRWKKSSI